MERNSDFTQIIIELKDGTAIVQEYENRIFEPWKLTFPGNSVTELFTAISDCFIDDAGIEEIPEIKHVDDIRWIRIAQSLTTWGESQDFNESDYDNVEYDEDMIIGTNIFCFIPKDGNFVFARDAEESECVDDFDPEHRCPIDFNGKKVVVSGFELEEDTVVRAIESMGGIVCRSISKKIDCLIWNPRYIGGYTVKLRDAIRLALNGSQIKIFECLDVSSLIFKEFQLPSVFEMMDSMEYARISASSVCIPRGDVLVRYHGCDKHVIVPDGPVMIASRAFYSHSPLKSLELPDSVRVIVDGAISGVERLVLPSYLQYIDLRYTSCQNLLSIATKYCDNKIYAIDNCLLEKSEQSYWKTIFDCETNQRLRVDWGNDRTERLDCKLIKGCINSVIPEYVSHIGAAAFLKCKGLKTLRLPNNLRIICEEAFCNCTELEEIRVPEGVEIIEDRAFNWCTALKCVYLPASLKIMDADVFYGCENVTLYVKANSYAEKYAIKSNLHYEYY